MKVSRDDCWLYLGPFTGRSSGAMYGVYGGKGAHRRSYESAKGEIPKGLQIDHLCMNTVCINPDHLEAVTNDENMRRRMVYKTHCVKGHPLSGDNVKLRTGRGWTERRCNACHIIWKRTARRKNKRHMKSLTKKNVLKIRRYSAMGWKERPLGKKLGIHPWNVYNVTHGRTFRWATLGSTPPRAEDGR